MKQWLLTVLLLPGGFSWTQEELKNVYNSYSEVYGGMEDGGISRTERFIFVAFRKIIVAGIAVDGEEVKLDPGDTLIVIVSTYIPYNKGTAELNKEPIGESESPEGETRFRVVRSGNTWYATVQWPYTWPGTISYRHRKKMYTTRVREGFDSGSTGYAP